MAAFRGDDRDIEMGLLGVAEPSGFVRAVPVMEQSELTFNLEIGEECTESKILPDTSCSDGDDSSTASRKASTSRPSETSLPPPRTPAVALDLINGALDNAEPAILSSRATVKAVAEAVIVGEKRQRTAIRLSEIDDGNRNSLFYRSVAHRYSQAVSCVTERSITLNTMINAAEKAFKDASDCAHNLTVLLLEDSHSGASAELEGQISAAYLFIDTLNSAVIETRKSEFKSLRAIVRCWAEIDDHAGGNVIINPRNVTIYGQNCDPKNRKFSYVGHVILFIAGCSLTGLSMLFRESTESFAALLVVAIFLIVWPTISFIHEIRKKYLKARAEARRKKTREVIAELTSKMEELQTYFRNNNIEVPEN